MSNFCTPLFSDSCCYAPCTIWRAQVAQRNGAHTASGNGRMRGSVLTLALRGEHSPVGERAYQGDADQVDAQCPPGLCITAGANPVYRRERKDAQRQHMQPPPPLVADVWAQPAADADGDAEIQPDDSEGHPLWTIMARERNEDLVPAEVGVWINPRGQDMHH